MRAAQWILALGAAIATSMAFAAPDAAGFQAPRLARIIFFHLPCAIATTIFLLIAGYASLRYVFGRQWRFEVQAVAANELGFLFAILTMATGILFSKVQWNSYWQWDPRQTSFLLVLFLFAGYFALRAGFTDERRRAANSAVYSGASLLPALFLIFVFPRLKHIQQASFHPSQTVADTVSAERAGFDQAYTTTLLVVMAAVVAVGIWLFRLRVRAGMAEHAVENLHERMDDRGDSAAPGVVRPVPVSKEH